MTKAEVQEFIVKERVAITVSGYDDCSIDGYEGEEGEDDPNADLHSPKTHLLCFRKMSCCGTRELVDVGEALRPEDWKLRMQAALTTLKESATGVVATTTNNMKVAAQKLRELDFTPHFVGRNPNSGNNITIWTRSLHELDSIYEKEAKPRAKRHAGTKKLRVQATTERASEATPNRG